MLGKGGIIITTDEGLRKLNFMLTPTYLLQSCKHRRRRRRHEQVRLIGCELKTIIAILRLQLKLKKLRLDEGEK